MGPEVNKFKQVSSDGHQMSLAAGGPGGSLRSHVQWTRAGGSLRSHFQGGQGACTGSSIAS